jgi:hypothetical protein
MRRKDSERSAKADLAEFITDQLWEACSDVETAFDDEWYIDDILWGRIPLDEEFVKAFKKGGASLVNELERAVFDTLRRYAESVARTAGQRCFDLELFNQQVLWGRHFGEKVRRLWNLDEEDCSLEVAHILVPKTTLSIDPSFFIGLFKKSMDTLGEDKFRLKYKFDCEKHIEVCINNGVSSILKGNRYGRGT